MADVRKDHQRLQENLRLLQKVHTAARLTEVLGISEKTWQNRMKAPWKHFSYDDFRMLSKYCRVDFSQLLDGTLTIR